MQNTDESAFLKDVAGWRDLLASDIARQNPQLPIHEANDCAQRTIDRIVFLRLCEDRDSATRGRSKDFLNRLFVCHASNESRPHGAFKNSPPITETKILKRIIEELYEPNRSYAISLLNCGILGRMYEQSLGKVVRPLKGDNAANTSLVKRTNGIYYTPGYIVDYIVENTVGKLLKGKTPEQVSKLRILDPACGCGSFLIGAYQKLLDWHRDNGHGTHPGRSTGHGAAKWRLNTDQRKRILKNNIFGVDSDSQAVEIAKRSLLLQALESQIDESNNSPRPSSDDFVLPDVACNVRCGNSLIGSTFSDHRQLDPCDDPKDGQFQAFDWMDEFPEVQKQGGFDVVIGNPPYRRELENKRFLEEIHRTDFGRRFRTARMDLWYYFLHRGLELLRPEGVLSFITNAYWTAGTGAEKLIAALRDAAHVDEIFSLNKLRVFPGVAGQHMILRITKSTGQTPTTVKLAETGSNQAAEPFVAGRAAVIEFQKTREQLFRHGGIDLQPPSDQLLAKIDQGTPLRALGKIRQGIVENPPCINRKLNEKFDHRWQVGQGVFALRDDELEGLSLPAAERSLIRGYHDLCDLDRYYIAKKPSRHLVYSTRKTCPDIDDYPVLRDHLKPFRPILEARRETRAGSNRWWHLHWPRDEILWQSPKIISLQMATRPCFVPAIEAVYVPFSANVFVPHNMSHEHLYYITALLNCRLAWKWYQHHAKRRGVGLEINGHVLASTPIRQINFDDPAERQRHDRIVTLVEQTLSLNERLRAASTDDERSSIEGQIKSIDEQIDSVIFELYELTDEEVQDVVMATTRA